MACSDSKKLIFILVGDSDISRWPSSEMPSLVDHSVMKHHNFKQPIFSNYSKSGELLQNVPSQVAKALKDLKGGRKKSKSKRKQSLGRQKHNHHHDHDHDVQHEHPSIFFIACAGENDLSSGFSVDTVVHSFHKLVDSIFSDSNCHDRPHLIFFGPKLEPWLNDNDNEEMRKFYYQLNERLIISSSNCARDVTIDHSAKEGQNHHCHSDGKNVSYIDSLTLFCGQSANERGSVLSGKAKADETYFDVDGLHLNQEGYKVWKQELERTLEQILCSERCVHSLDMSHGNKVVLD